MEMKDQQPSNMENRDSSAASSQQNTPASPNSSAANNSVIRRTALSNSVIARTQTGQLYRHIAGGLTPRSFVMNDSADERNSSSVELGLIQTMVSTVLDQNKTAMEQNKNMISAVIEQNKAVMEQNKNLNLTLQTVTEQLQQLSITNKSLVDELRDIRKDANGTQRLLIAEFQSEKESLKDEKNDMRKERESFRAEIEQLRLEKERLKKEEEEIREKLHKGIIHKLRGTCTALESQNNLSLKNDFLRNERLKSRKQPTSGLKLIRKIISQQAGCISDLLCD